MNVEELLSKYREFGVRYDCSDNSFVFYQPISVKDFVEFKKDLIESQIYYKNIYVIRRRWSL